MLVKICGEHYLEADEVISVSSDNFDEKIIQVTFRNKSILYFGKSEFLNIEKIAEIINQGKTKKE